MVFFDETRPREVKVEEAKVEAVEDDAEFDEIAEIFGGPEAMQRQLVRGHLAALRMGREWPALTEQYPDQWVAMDEDGVAAVADSHEALLAALAAKGIYAGDLVIELMETDPEVLIL